jgi:hypothetical protein
MEFESHPSLQQSNDNIIPHTVKYAHALKYSASEFDIQDITVQFSVELNPNN